MPNGGQRVRSVDFTAAVSDVQNASGTTTQTSFTSTLTGGTACGVAFLAPSSGQIEIVNTAAIFNSGANDTYVSWELRTGAVIGSGTSIIGPDNNRALRHNGTTTERSSIADSVSGLSPGNAYNVRQMFRVNIGMGTYVSKALSVKPLP